jgi:putative oxidoreductase
MSNTPGITPLVGRILLSLMLVWSGFSKVMAFSLMTGYAAAKHLPAPALAIGAAAAIEILGALAIIFGFKTKCVAWVIFLYLIPVTLVFHNFWAVQGPGHIDSLVHFMKNTAIMGGFLMLAAFGAGGYSLDAVFSKKP